MTRSMHFVHRLILADLADLVDLADWWSVNLVVLADWWSVTLWDPRFAIWSRVDRAWIWRMCIAFIPLFYDENDSNDDRHATATTTTDKCNNV